MLLHFDPCPSGTRSLAFSKLQVSSLPAVDHRLQAQRRGEVYLTKHDLINQAEGLHLTNKPIKGQAPQMLQLMTHVEPICLRLEVSHSLTCSFAIVAGNPNVPTGPGMFVYDGWSCFNSLTNREPPLAQVYSNPKKCRLTPEVGNSLF